MREEYRYFKQGSLDVLSKPFAINEIEKIEVMEFTSKGNFEEALRECFEIALEEGNDFYVYENEKEILCVFGLVRTPLVKEGTYAGTPWLLSSENFKPDSEFIRESKRVVNEDMLSNGVTVLHNYIHQDNVKAIRWLKWIGFKFLMHPWKDDYREFYLYKE